MRILYFMKVSKSHPRKSFTLVEMVVVIAIIIILSTLVLPAFVTMWNDAQVRGSYHKIENLLRVARARSLSLHHIAYGVLFYVDPIYNHQVAVYIDALTYPIAPDEVWPDVINRFRVDTESIYLFVMDDFVRMAPFSVAFGWENEDLLNDDYRSGKQRNFFAIIFQRGRRALLDPFILYDEDENKDGLGDTLKLVVGDSVGEFGGPMRDIVIDNNDERRVLPTDWGFLIYNEDTFQEMRPDYLNLVPYHMFHPTRYGQVVRLER